MNVAEASKEEEEAMNKRPVIAMKQKLEPHAATQGRIPAELGGEESKNQTVLSDAMG